MGTMGYDAGETNPVVGAYLCDVVRARHACCKRACVRVCRARAPVLWARVNRAR